MEGIDRETHHCEPHHPTTTQIVADEEIHHASAQCTETIATDQDAGFGVILEACQSGSVSVHHGEGLCTQTQIAHHLMAGRKTDRMIKHVQPVFILQDAREDALVEAEEQKRCETAC